MTTNPSKFTDNIFHPSNVQKIPSPLAKNGTAITPKRYVHLFSVHVPLFINKRFALNEMFQRNTSKFAIFYVKENPCSFFHFSFRATLYFYLMNALVYVVDIDQGIHKVKI